MLNSVLLCLGVLFGIVWFCLFGGFVLFVCLFVWGFFVFVFVCFVSPPFPPLREWVMDEEWGRRVVEGGWWIVEIRKVEGGWGVQDL